jgi:protein O-mannosyl-transferase
MNIKKGVIPLKLLIIIFLVTSTTFIAYYPALNNDFQTWDTRSYVIDNPNIKALTWENLQWMFTSFYRSNWHPLTWLSHALDYAWFGLNPWGHHLVSLIIHSLNSVLLFALVIALISFKPSAENALRFVPVNNKTLLAAGVAAILFGIHPQHVESVVWVAERKDVLCLFFILLALLSYVFYNAVHTINARIGWYLSTLLCFVLALLAKPMAVTFPVILLLMDVYPLNRTRLTASHQRNCVSYKRLVFEKIPFFIFTLFSAALTFLAQHQGGSISGLEQLGIQIRLLNAFNSLIFYISKFIFPIGLSPFYPYPSYSRFHEYYPSLIPVIAGFFITFVCGYLWYKKKYYWLIAWLFYLLTLSPVIGIIQVGVQAAADRYVYLPTIPFYILIGVGIACLLDTEKIKKVLKVGIVIVFLLISVGLVQLTQKQTFIWKNDVIFWNYVVAYAPDSALVRFHLGNVYLERGEYKKAIVHYHHATSLEPDKKWYINLPIAYIELDKLQEAQNILNRLMENSTDVEHNWDYFYHMTGWIYFKQGRLQEAQEALKKALQLNPENKRAQDLLLEIASRQ